MNARKNRKLRRERGRQIFRSPIIKNLKSKPRLGKYDGLDLLQDIRNTYDKLPVIICTAYPSFRHRLKSVAADDYVVKSSDLRELKLKIGMAFAGRQKFPSVSADITIEQTKTTPIEQMDLPWKGAH